MSTDPASSLIAVPGVRSSSRRRWRPSLIRAVLAGAVVLAFCAAFVTPTIEVTLEMKSTAGPHAEVYFVSGTDDFNAKGRVYFRARANGEWRTYSVLVPEVRELSRLRIDPGNDVGDVSLRMLQVGGRTPRTFEREQLGQMLGTLGGMLRLPDSKTAIELSSAGHDPNVEIRLPPGVGGVSLTMRMAQASAVAARAACVWLALDLLVAAALAWLWQDERRGAQGRALAGGFYQGVSWSFLGSFMVLGLCLAFVQPVFSIPDETMHWLVGHTRAERLLGDQDCINTLPIGHSNRHAKNLVPYGELQGMALNCVGQARLYGDTMTYPGVLLSKLILPRQQESATRQFQAVLVARLLQGALFALTLARLVSLAQLTARVGVMCVVALSLSPLLAQQAFGVSSDGAQLCFAACLFAVLVFWERLSWLDVALFVAFGWGAAGKPFLLACVLPSVIAGFWFAQVRTRDATAWQSIKALALAFKPSRRPTPQAVVLWSSILISVLLAAYVLIEGKNGRITDTSFANVDAKRQLLAVLAEPWNLVRVVLRYAKESLSHVVHFTAPLGWLDTPISEAVVNGFTRLVVVALIIELLALPFWTWRPAQRSPWRVSVARTVLPLLIAIAGAIGSVFIVIASLYLGLTPVGADYVDGVQVRYFFPTMIVAFGAVYGAVNTLLAAPPEPESAPAALVPTSVERAAWARWLAVRVLPPVLVFGLSLPYVARVFIDLGRRYL